MDPAVAIALVGVFLMGIMIGVGGTLIAKGDKYLNDLEQIVIRTDTALRHEAAQWQRSQTQRHMNVVDKMRGLMLRGDLTKEAHADILEALNRPTDVEKARNE